VSMTNSTDRVEIITSVQRSLGRCLTDTVPSGPLERDGRVDGGLRPSAPESRMPIARGLVTSFRDLPDRLGEQRRAEPAAVAYCLDLAAPRLRLLPARRASFPLWNA